MTDREWMLKNIEARNELLKHEPKTRKEKDIWNLKWILTSIEQGSLWYRIGCVSTLRRVIKRLEGEND